MTARRGFAVLIWLLAVINVAILAIRLVSLFHTSSLVQAPNGEAINLYSIWKLRHGYPLYELVTRRPFSITLYNYVFYYVYAGAMSLLGTGDEAMSFWARVPTLAFALAGAWIQYALTVASVTRACGRCPRTLAALLALVTWIGVGIVGWLAVSIRPESGAAAAAVAGLGLCWRAQAHGRRNLFVAAGLAFACGWLFKQSFVMLFAGAAAYLLAWRRSPGDVVRLTTPFVLVAGLSLALGTPEYRFDVFRAQSFPSISIHDAQFWLRSGLLPNLLMWAVPAWWIVEGRRSVRVDDALALVICAAVVSGTWALAAIGREGASTHYLFEPSIPAALWTAIVLCTLDADPAHRRRGFIVAMWASLPMVVFAGALLCHLGRVQAIVGLRARGDRLTLGLPGEFERRAAIRDRMRDVPPVFVRDEVLSLPWFSNRNRYPAIQIEHVIYDAVERRGLTGEGFRGLIRERYFGGIIAEPGSQLAADARSDGYLLRGALPAPIGDTLEIYTR